MATIEETKTYDNWHKFICDLEKSSKDGNKIYRGQSNDPCDPENEWTIVSSYNRLHSKYKNKAYYFRTILNQHLSPRLFSAYYGDYAFNQIEDLKQLTSIQRAYYFQHYGIPTCLIDFTKCPLIASYFGISSVPGTNVTYADDDNNIIPFTNNAFITIYELDAQKLIDILNVKEINSKSFTSKKYDDYLKELWSLGFHIGIDLNPLDESMKESNFNLNQQKGVFILYDNYNSNIDLIFAIDSLAKEIGCNDKIIKKYRLKTNAIYEYLPINNTRHNLYTYLKSKQRTGQFLFNDLQGLKYDFNFLHS